MAGAAKYVLLGFDTFGKSLKKAYVSLVRERQLGIGGVKSAKMLVRIYEPRVELQCLLKIVDRVVTIPGLFRGKGLVIINQS